MLKCSFSETNVVSADKTADYEEIKEDNGIPTNKNIRWCNKFIFLMLYIFNVHCRLLIISYFSESQFIVSVADFSRTLWTNVVSKEIKSCQEEVISFIWGQNVASCFLTKSSFWLVDADHKYLTISNNVGKLSHWTLYILFSKLHMHKLF